MQKQTKGEKEMSLIPCPECGRQISDSAQHCVHCGTPLTFCPECKNVLPPKTTACPNCGYALSSVPTTLPNTVEKAITQSPSPKTEQSLSLTTCEELYKAWTKEPTTNKALTKRKLHWIFTGISLLFYLVALFVFIPYLKKFNAMSDYQRAIEIVTLKNKLSTAIIIMIIGDVIATCGAIFQSGQELYIHLSLSKWLPTCKKDYKPAILQALTTKSDLYVGKAEVLAVASWLHEDEQRKKLRIGTTIANCVLQFIGFIITCVMLTKLPDLIFLSAGQGIALMPILKKLLGILAIMVIPTVIGTILEEIFKSTGKKWVKNYYKEQENK